MFLFTHNVTFTDLNMVERKSLLKLNLGGCIRTMNILHRKIIKLVVNNVYSDETNVGLKIIDYNSNINSLKTKSNADFIVK